MRVFPVPHPGWGVFIKHKQNCKQKFATNQFKTIFPTFPTNEHRFSTNITYELIFLLRIVKPLRRKNFSQRSSEIDTISLNCSPENQPKEEKI